jgi:hypothetical protein
MLQVRIRDFRLLFCADASFMEHTGPKFSHHQFWMTHSLVGHQSSGCGWLSRFQFWAVRGG